MTLLLKKYDENCIERAQVNEFKKNIFFVMMHKSERWESSHRKNSVLRRKKKEKKRNL